jgi:HEAT repeat protein
MAGSRPEKWNGEPIPYNEPIEVLRNWISTRGPKAGPAFRALAELHEPEAMAVLVDLTRSADPYLRTSAVHAIANSPSGRNAADVVLSMLHDHNGFVVRAACGAAADLGLAAGHDRILGLVSANEESTRLSALEALEVLWEPSDFEMVFARYLCDRSDRVRKRAAWTLNKNIGTDHWKRVFEAWSRDPVPRHRVWACSIAERFGERDLLPSLKALRSDADGHVRHAAEQAAKLIGERVPHDRHEFLCNPPVEAEVSMARTDHVKSRQT